MKTEDLYSLYLQHPIVCTDSRDVRPGSIFFALSGERHDGNKFAADAIAAGSSYAVIDDESVKSGSAYVLVENTLRALQNLAARHRQSLSCPVLAITGSNGKTTTKELLFAILSRKYAVRATAGNLNNHIGVPLTLLSVPKSSEFVIVEMGANHLGEIESLCRIARPGYGIITNIGKAHLEGFGGPEGVIRAKSELYDFLRINDGMVFYHSDDPLLAGLSEGMNRVGYGMNSGRIRGRQAEEFPALALEWWDENGGERQGHLAQTQLTGSYNLVNALCAACVGCHFGVDPGSIGGALSSYVPVNNRSQVLRTKSNTLLLDAYNANPTSVEAALDSFGRYSGTKKAVVLGDMLELGDHAEAEHLRIASIVRDMQLDWVLLVGSTYFQMRDKFPFAFVESAAEGLQWLRSRKIEETTVLIKGSRRLALERLASAL